MVEGDPVFRFLLTNPDEANIRQATYDATRSRGRAFAFVYTVQADDRDTDGIEIRDHTPNLLTGRRRPNLHDLAEYRHRPHI